MNELASFWASRNSAGKVVVAIPGLVNVVYVAFLPRALQFRYALEGEALAAAMKMVMEHIQADIAKPRRPRSGWVGAWRDIGWRELNRDADVNLN